MKESKSGDKGIYAALHEPESVVHEHTLVLVHGSFGASWMWMQYVPFFVKSGWSVYTLDLRGHGKSAGTVDGATMQDYVDDVDTVVSEQRIKTPIVIGHSMGGLVALMYMSQHGGSALVSIGGSPTLEVMGGGSEEEYKSSYTPMDAGMPFDPMEVMKALPDISQEMLMKMKEMLGKESGVARSERKRGVSVSKESVESIPKLFMGSELADTVGFGINADVARKHAKYYGGDVKEISGTTHPGILAGEHAMEAAGEINEWLSRKGL